MGGDKLRYDSIDGSGLTANNRVHLESSESRETARQNILEILLDENGIGYLPQCYFHVNRKAGHGEFRLWTPSPLGRTNYTYWLHNLRIVLDFENFQARKQYDRLDDVPSILQRMKEVYAIPDRQTRYVATKKSSIQEHGVKMLSAVEKLEDLKVGLDNDTEASTSKVKGKRVERWKKKKGKAKAKTVVVAKDAKSAPIALVEMAKKKERWVLSSSRGKTISAPIAVRKGIERGIVPIYFPIKVLQRSKKLNKDEVVLRLGDGKAVAAEAVGIINLVISDRVRLELKNCYFVPSMIKNIISIPSLDNAGFGMKRLVDSKSLEIDTLDNLPAYESCLKGKMTRKPFVRQSTLANGLLNLIYTDICGPLNTQAKGGFSYFITFTDDHSRYGYIYLMRYKSEAFVRFKDSGFKLRTKLVTKLKSFGQTEVESI
ncbi:Retrovirus-related Pol polyprotein from transposon TNT 1-94 [Sesamum angolense]|uniref:Retrovirus-related Pol polyprotein from transposon TNT 1-94 n=1 Tax=Sesamum angolense TaxID=2727404 RepID=A0AAE1W7L8_9LAMI|nr:Retrovirus-related Pol polyprotein from transposon TNT 1-94 [Sesamum angolense]